MKNCKEKFLLMIIILMFGLGGAKAQNEVEGIHYATGEPVKITVKNGKISKIQEIKKLSNSNNKLFIAPGFFDNQINGFAGVSFSFGNSDLTSEGVEKATSELWKKGVTTYLPT